MDGLSFLRHLLDSGTTPPGIGHTLDFSLQAVDAGSVTLTARPSKAHYNPLGTVHGGYAATVLDGAMALALHSTLPAGQGYTTTALTIHYTRPMTAESAPLRAIGKLVQRGGRAASATAELFDAEGRLCAHGSSALMIFDIPAAKA
ncbi:PaaI family thioesterase [Ferrovibrio sp.]|uniref:PaaI family thioesterase n=1 Tax=Ferrovibrio sp. TaxID=1917215 RepID=UPI00260D799E|nr:PaaI family thioesterase [Ferrovibrio sp.]